MRLLCAPVKSWPQKRPVDLYEFTEGKQKLLYDRDQTLRFIDIDWKERRCSFKDLIISYHNWRETPDLEPILSAMKARHPGARYYKIASFANSTLDALRMLRLQKNHPEVIGLCMGEKGTMTRILSPFTYAPLVEADKNAPGQLLWSELETVYHYRGINAQTRLYGLIGNPVAQSIGHLYHNDQFRQNKINGVYLKMVVTPEEVPAFLEAIQPLAFYGLSVTAPLKEKIIPGSVINTLYRTAEGWKYCNTDGVAVAGLIGKRSKGKQVVILGAGGAAQAIAAALIQGGACVTLLQRQMPIPTYDILINATSSPNPDFKDRFLRGKYVMDISIRTTPFLLKARAAGCETIDGLPMYFSQALLQSTLWKQSICS